MELLRNKTILIISPQSWGKMLISKHHYAIELTKRNNRVYFLNPPNSKATLKKRRIQIVLSEDNKNLYLINHRLFFPYDIKFHFIFVFHKMMRIHLNQIIKQIGRPLEIIWSFDLGNFYPFSYFGYDALKIFHPVDEQDDRTAYNSAKGADIIFSVTKEILDKYSANRIPMHFINHGISDDFLQTPSSGNNNEKKRVGYSGNLWRVDIDRKIFLQIITENPEIVFECWGSYHLSDVDYKNEVYNDTLKFINQLKQCDNLILHGSVSTDILAQGIKRMDAFLICYDVHMDQSHGTNYHKVMEYLSAGKVIISNNITTYKDEYQLVQMVAERSHNGSLPILFKKVINSLEIYNSEQLQSYRKSYAQQNTYSMQIKRIEAHLEALK